MTEDVREVVVLRLARSSLELLRTQLSSINVGAPKKKTYKKVVEKSHLVLILDDCLQRLTLRRGGVVDLLKRMSHSK